MIFQAPMALFPCEVRMPIALMYRWAIFVLLIVGLILLMKHKVLTPFVFWSRIQYYTFSTFTLFVFWLGADRKSVV